MVSANTNTVSDVPRSIIRNVPRTMEILPDEIATHSFNTSSGGNIITKKNGRKDDHRNYVDLGLDSNAVSSYAGLY